MSAMSPSSSPCTALIPYESSHYFLDKSIISASTTPVNYSRVLKTTNLKVETLALNLLRSDPDVFSTLGKVCVAYTGSDGRQEKFCPNSPLDLIVIGDNEEETTQAHTAI